MTKTYTAVITKDDGWYTGKLDDTGGAFASAKNLADLHRDLRTVLRVELDAPTPFEILFVDEDGHPLTDAVEPKPRRTSPAPPAGIVQGGSAFFKFDGGPPAPR